MDVIIVGAGAAGLSAAKECARLGISYQVVEAAGRIGGRAYSEEIAPGEWFDHGCAWLVGGETNPFATIAGELGVALSTEPRARFRLDHLRFHRDGASLRNDQQDACRAFYRTCDAAIAAAADQGRDIAVSEVIDLEHDYAPPFLAAVAAAWGKEVDEVSTVDYTSSVGDLGYQALRGYGNLVAAWGADVPVTLNAGVERIDWSGRTVSVETGRGTVSARAVALTVSTGVLGSDEGLFSPRLPDWKLDAIHNLPMGTENKVGVHFDRDVFGEDARAYYTTWNADGHAAKVDASVMGLNTASVLVGGRQGVQLEKDGPGALEAFAVDRLADIFGNAIRTRVTRCIATAWASQPLTRGSWSCALPGHGHQRTNLACPIDDRLFFAGEATLYGAQGTCHGAYQSGLRAAREFASALAANVQVIGR